MPRLYRQGRKSLRGTTFFTGSSHCRPLQAAIHSFDIITYAATSQPTFTYVPDTEKSPSAQDIAQMPHTCIFGVRLQDVFASPLLHAPLTVRQLSVWVQGLLLILFKAFIYLLKV